MKVFARCCKCRLGSCWWIFWRVLRCKKIRLSNRIIRGTRWKIIIESVKVGSKLIMMMMRWFCRNIINLSFVLFFFFSFSVFLSFCHSLIEYLPLNEYAIGHDYHEHLVNVSGMYYSRKINSSPSFWHSFGTAAMKCNNALCFSFEAIEWLSPSHIMTYSVFQPLSEIHVHILLCDGCEC